MSYKYDKNKKFHKKQTYMDKTTYGVQGQPEGEGKTDLLLSLKALKNLPKSAYSLLADPYLAALPDRKSVV